MKLRRRNDTFYDDYLHRGCLDIGTGATQQQTPLADMSYLEYGVYVRVVLGDPWALRPNQYAFEEHHRKRETHVQELRPTPAAPFIHGFTMPTKEKDPETKTDN